MRKIECKILELILQLALKWREVGASQAIGTAPLPTHSPGLVLVFSAVWLIVMIPTERGMETVCCYSHCESYLYSCHINSFLVLS